MIQSELDFDKHDSPLLALFAPDTDNYNVLLSLLDGRWHDAPEYMEGMDRRGMVVRNFAYRSRISDIGKKIAPEGWEIESRRKVNSRIYEYRLRYIDGE